MMSRLLPFLLCLTISFVWIPTAGFANPLPPDDGSLPNIGINEKLGAQLPRNLILTDQDGRSVRLGDYLGTGPVILTLNYYSCPMLCPVIFRNLATEISAIKGLSPEKDYRVVTVSFDPDETLARAKAKAVESWRMLPQLRNPEKRWPFLIGGEGAITELAKATGFRYTRLGKNNFAHPSVLVILTPEGKVARYLYGIEQRPSDLKLALVEAAGGKIGGTRFLNQVLLYCFHYDPVEKKYAVTAINLMKITGAAVLAMLGILLLVLWRKEKKSDDNGPEVR